MYPWSVFEGLIPAGSAAMKTDVLKWSAIILTDLVCSGFKSPLMPAIFLITLNSSWKLSIS